MATTLTLLQALPTLAYSKNPIYVKLELTHADNHLLLHMFDRDNNEVTTLYGRPDSDLKVEFNIAPILDTLVDWEVPNLTLTSDNVTDAIMKYGLRADELMGDIIVDTMDIGISFKVPFLVVVKGGISEEQTATFNFNYLTNNLKWLTWANDVVLTKNQPYFLYYLSQIASVETVIPEVVVYYDDDTFSKKYLKDIAAIDIHQMVYFNVNWYINKLDELEPTKTAIKYTVSLSGDAELSAGIRCNPFTFWLNEKYLANELYFLYANSLGGFDGLFSSGNKNVKRGGESEQALQIHPYTAKLQNISFNHKLSRNNKIATGHKSKKEIERLHELFASSHLYEVENSRLIRLSLNKGEIEYNETDNLFSFLLDYSRSTINTIFTPDEISI